MIRAFTEVDDQMRSQYGPTPTNGDFAQADMVELSGCTGSVILVQEDYFVIANAGDSPAIIFRESNNKKTVAFVGE